MVSGRQASQRFRPIASVGLRAGGVGAIALISSLLIAPSGAPPTAPETSPELRARFDTVIIDAGHGGEDHGARGRAGLVEKEVVLDVAQRLASRLRQQGVEVVLTRTEDRFVPLEVRTSIANDARADLFLSIHANASRVRGARGAETFFASLEATDEASRALALAENAAFGEQGLPEAVADPLVAILGDLIATEQLAESQEFAQLAEDALAQRAPFPSRGVKQAPFVVLLGVQMPAVLVEVGFVSNGAEEQALKREAERDRIAEQLAVAVAGFAERYDARRGVNLPAAEAD